MARSTSTIAWLTVTLRPPLELFTDAATGSPPTVSRSHRIASAGWPRTLHQFPTKPCLEESSALPLRTLGLGRRRLTAKLAQPPVREVEISALHMVQVPRLQRLGTSAAARTHLSYTEPH